MAGSKKAYDNNSIKALKGEERIRQKPASILGSDGLEGCEHTLVEILANSLDEAREGYGKVIEVTRFKDKSIMVKDYGRGCPVDYNPAEGRYNWELVYCELYASGKYDTNKGENYEYSLGTNGLGSCAAQCTSEYMEVTVLKDGFKYELSFKKGKNVGGLKKEPCEYKQSGTTQKWRPDLEVFTDIDIPLEFYTTLLKKQAVVNAGLKLKLYDEESNKRFEYLYENGILDYVKEVSGDKGITEPLYFETETRGRDREDKDEYKLKMQLAFCFNNEVNLLEYYHNSSFLVNGGSPDKAVRNAFVAEFDKFLRANNRYTKDEPKISFGDIQDSLILVTSSFSTQTSYENQTKKAITNRFIQEAMTDFIRSKLEIYLIENKLEADKIVNQLLANKHSREEAEKRRVAIKRDLMTNKMDMTNRVKKFVTCRTNDVTKRELYIVEGDSALGSVKQGRNAEFQAIMPVRGKTLNCIKASEKDIFSSPIITDLIKVLGCGIELKTKMAKDISTFDIDNLRWDKIIICTDADVDGYQIRTLILTMFYRLLPTLLQKGKVYIVESPLYEITYKEGNKEKTAFAFDEKEKADILAGIRGKYTLQRSKGLGENSPEMMSETTMRPDKRRLIRIVPTDVESMEYTFEMLLGDNIDDRKTHIRENGKYYLDKLDLA